MHNRLTRVCVCVIVGSENCLCNCPMTRLSAGKSVFRNILKRREVTHCPAPIGALVLPEAGRHPEEAQGEDEQEEEERGHAVHHCQAGANTGIRE